MHIYDVANPQGLFCQSKANVKCKQHLVLLKTMYGLPSFLLSVAPSSSDASTHFHIETPSNKEFYY